MTRKSEASLDQGPEEFRQVDRPKPKGNDSAGGMIICSKRKIEHEYHHGKDKMKIAVHGYSPSKKSRDAIKKHPAKNAAV
jgi:hypothetical protein